MQATDQTRCLSFLETSLLALPDPSVSQGEDGRKAYEIAQRALNSAKYFRTELVKEKKLSAAYRMLGKILVSSENHALVQVLEINPQDPSLVKIKKKACGCLSWVKADELSFP